MRAIHHQPARCALEATTRTWPAELIDGEQLGRPPKTRPSSNVTSGALLASPCSRLPPAPKTLNPNQSSEPSLPRSRSLQRLGPVSIVHFAFSLLLFSSFLNSAPPPVLHCSIKPGSQRAWRPIICPFLFSFQASARQPPLFIPPLRCTADRRRRRRRRTSIFSPAQTALHIGRTRVRAGGKRSSSATSVQ